MATLALVPKPGNSSASPYQHLIDLVVPTLFNVRTRYRYATVLRQLFEWMAERNLSLCRVSVQRYIAQKQKPKEQGGDNWSPNTVNQALAAIRYLAREANEQEMLPDHVAKRIISIKMMRPVVRNRGRWLTREQVGRMMQAINLVTPHGMRDFVALGLMVGAGMRRAEVCSIKCEQVELLNGRLAVYDLLGKGGKYRTVPLPAWLSAAIVNYKAECGIRDGYLIRGICGSTGKLLPSRAKPMGTLTIEKICKQRSAAVGTPVDPHDLRRTFAKLALDGGAKLEQISLTLGHASITVTQKYLGLGMDTVNPACDSLDVEVR